MPPDICAIRDNPPFVLLLSGMLRIRATFQGDIFAQDAVDFFRSAHLRTVTGTGCVSTDITSGQGPITLQMDEPVQRYAPQVALQPGPSVTVCEPMTVLWQGVEYSVAHWDVHGFTLARAIPTTLAPGRGRVIDVSLLIGQGETRIQMGVQVRGDTGTDTGLRYQFIDLGRAQAELLHRIVDYSVTRQELSLTQLLNDSRETRAARQDTTKRVLAFRTWFQISLACAALGGALYMALGAFSTVTSRYAAVSAAAASVSAPAAGMVSQFEAREGMRVARGEVLAYLRTPDHDSRVEANADRLRALEAEQAELRARKLDLDRHDAHGAQMADSERARLREAVSRAEQRLGLERAQLSALSSGLPTLERQQARTRQQALVLGAEAELAAARAAFGAFEVAQDHGLAAIRTAGTGAGGMTQETLELRMSHLAREIELAYARQDLLDKGLPVISPCDCEVAQITRVTGEWADPAQPLFVMAHEGLRTVHALVMADSAGRIRQGDRAQIRLADGQSLTGRVAALSYDSQRAGVAGLQNVIFATERYARVEIIPDTTTDLMIGMTGTVTIRTLDPLGWLGIGLGG